MTATEIAGGSQQALDIELNTSSGSGNNSVSGGPNNNSGGGGGKGGGNGNEEEGGSSSGIAGIIDGSENESSYHLKWIQWNSGKIPIVMQSRNGPCPLIATMNVLLLREKVKLPTMLEQITANQLLTYLGECIMESVPPEIQNDENALLNLEQHIHDAMEILPKLKTGLDVNIRFTGITDFEYTPECIIFDLLRIPLYHGWLSDPSLIELQNAIGNQSYNQLVDNIISNKNSTNPEDLAKVLIAEEFLERTASQLTLHGLDELRNKIKDNEIGILFRNNHFLTLFKREGEIYTLVTDHGYLTEDNIIWETLDNIEGVGRFFDSNFQLSEITNTRQVSEFNAIDQRQQQLESDFLIALSLKEEEQSSWSGGGGGGGGTRDGGKEGEMVVASGNLPQDDFELAKQLQAEEDRIYEEMVRERQVREAQQQQQRHKDTDKNRESIENFKAPQSGSQATATTTTESSPSSETLSNFHKVQQDQLVSPPNPTNEAEFPPLVEPNLPLEERSLQQAEIDPSLKLNPSTSATDLHATSPQGAQSTSSLDQQPQQQQRPVSRKLSNSRQQQQQRSKSEKNSKESNCIVN